MSVPNDRRPRHSALAGAIRLLLLGPACLTVVYASPPDPSAAIERTRKDPMTLSGMSRIWTRATPQLPARAGAGAPAMSRMDALGALTGGSPAGLDWCATPLMLALHQRAGELNQPTRLLLDRVTRRRTSSPERTLTSPDGEFLLHYWTGAESVDWVDPTDLDLDGAPDGVERIASELTDVLADVTHTLDWPPAPLPAATGAANHPVDVYLAGLGGPSGPPGATNGFTLPAPFGGDAEASDAVIFLDTGLADPGAVSRPEVAHQVAHMVQMRESSREAPWWHESSALWLEARLAHDEAALAAREAGAPSDRSEGIATDTLAPGLEGFLWPHYLIQSTGGDPALLRRLWEEMAAIPGDNTLDAMDRVLSWRLSTSLAEEVRVFDVWNLFLGQADDGHHYRFGSLLPTPQGDGSYEFFPVRGASLSGPIAPLGAAVVRLLGDGSSGGLRVRFAGGSEGAWDVALLVYGVSDPDDVRFVPLEVDGSGRAEIALPWSRLAAIDVLVQNLTTRAGAKPEDWSFAIDYDPVVPFDLLGFGASDSGRGAVLSWSTDSEERLAGWNVYRSTAPLGPFSRINRYLVPGAGTTTSPMSYLFVDGSAEPGGKYYYYLEGVTFEGFSESSHPAGVRMGAPLPSRSSR